MTKKKPGRPPRRWAWLVVVAIVLGASVPAASARRAPPPPPPLRVSFVPLAGSAFRYRFELSNAGGAPIEVVADRRLLELEVQTLGTRRKHRCRHDGAPTRADRALARVTLAPGERFAEWVDVRMLCWGRALSALEAGAMVAPRYGFRARGRGRWVFRETESSPGMHAVSGETVGIATLVRVEPPGPVRVLLRPVDVARGASVVFRASLRAGEGGEGRWIYLRGDLFRFRVVTPTGETHDCSPDRITINPIVDFFARLSSRRGPTVAIDAARICGPIFQAQGIYEVRPIVDLVYDGAAFGRDTVTGTFEGSAVPVRIRRGNEPPQPQPIDAAGSP